LVGANPGEVARPSCVHRWGALAQCEFDAVWAIQVGAGPGAVVLSVKESPTMPVWARSVKVQKAERMRWERWASTIYNAGVRRPRLGSLAIIPEEREHEKAWKAYVGVAREIKRELRKLRK